MAKKKMASELRKKQILNVAVRLFSQKGFSGTKTKEIAKKAGISEAMIFRYFDKKEKLYSAIINEKIGDGEKKETFFPIEAAEKKEDLKVFEMIALQLIEENEKDSAFMRLLLFSALEKHKLSEIFIQNYMLKLFMLFSNYIKKRIKDNAFIKVNPEIAVRGFIGMILHYIITQEIFGGKELMRFSKEDVATTFAAIFLSGIKK